MAFCSFLESFLTSSRISGGRMLSLSRISPSSSGSSDKSLQAGKEGWCFVMLYITTERYLIYLCAAIRSSAPASTYALSTSSRGNSWPLALSSAAMVLRASASRFNRDLSRACAKLKTIKPASLSSRANLPLTGCPASLSAPGNSVGIFALETMNTSLASVKTSSESAHRHWP